MRFGRAVEHGSGMTRAEPLLARNWPLLALRGVCSMAFGLLAWAWSDADAKTLARVVGVLAAAMGVLSLATATGARDRAERPWAMAVQGAASCLVAAVLLTARAPDETRLSQVAAAWVAIVGLLEGATAREVRAHARTPKLLVAFALVSLGVSLSLFSLAGADAIVVVWLLGAWACLSGACALWLATAVRSAVTQDRIVVQRASAPFGDSAV